MSAHRLTGFQTSLKMRGRSWSSKPKPFAPRSAAYVSNSHIFLGWMVPLLVYLGVRVYAPSVISDLGKWLNTSLPPSVTMTRSSIRTPNAPGR